MIGVDVKLSLNEDGQTYGLTIANGDFVGTQGLDTTVLTGLLSDGRASESEVTQAEFRNGWIGDLVNEDGFQLGSLLWTLDQERRTSAALAKAIDLTEKALEWLITNGLAKDVSVSGALTTSGALLTVVITTLSGSTDTRYVPLWRETVNAD